MDMRTLGMVLIVVVLVLTAASEVIKRLLLSKVERLFAAGDFDGCLKVIGGSLARLTMPSFNREFMRLNALELKQDDEAAAEVIERLLRKGCSPKQRLALLARGFEFYAAQLDRDKASHMLELVESSGDKGLLRSCRVKFDIVFDKKSGYIHEMEEALPDASPEERAQLCYLLSLQYENKGDKRRADEYLRKSLEVAGITEDAAKAAAK